MNLNEYQESCKATAIYPKAVGVGYCTLGLVSEAGEVAGKLKKALRDAGGDLDPEVVASELGDVLWYVAMLAHELGYTLNELAAMNLDKLTGRKERGTLGGSGDNR